MHKPPAQSQQPTAAAANKLQRALDVLTSISLTLGQPELIEDKTPDGQENYLYRLYMSTLMRMSPQQMTNCLSRFLDTHKYARRPMPAELLAWGGVASETVAETAKLDLEAEQQWDALDIRYTRDGEPYVFNAERITDRLTLAGDYALRQIGWVRGIEECDPKWLWKLKERFCAEHRRYVETEGLKQLPEAMRAALPSGRGQITSGRPLLPKGV